MKKYALGGDIESDKKNGESEDTKYAKRLYGGESEETKYAKRLYSEESKTPKKPSEIDLHSIVKKAANSNGMKKGGMVSSASKRADGCAIKGKTKGRMV
jgi:hypothetical protein